MPRAPKPFGPNQRDSWVNENIARALGIQTSNRQVNIVTLAPTKAEAISTLQMTALIGSRSGHYVKTQMGNSVNALIDSGLLAYDPDLPSAIVYKEAHKDQPIVKVTPCNGAAGPNGERVFHTVVGHWRLVDHRIVAEPASASD